MIAWEGASGRRFKEEQVGPFQAGSQAQVEVTQSPLSEQSSEVVQDDMEVSSSMLKIDKTEMKRDENMFLKLHRRQDSLDSRRRAGPHTGGVEIRVLAVLVSCLD